jgi:hypothetical protein
MGWCNNKKMTIVDTNKRARKLLEHLHRCSVCDSRQLNLLWKSQNVPVELRKLVFMHQIRRASPGWEIGFYAPNSWSFPWLGKSCNTVVHLQKRVINWTWLLFSVSDWSIIMIGQDGLLLVVLAYMQFQLQFYWWGRQKKQLYLEIQFYCPQWDTEHWWRFS